MYKLCAFFFRIPFLLMLSFVVAVSGDCSRPKKKMGLIPKEITQTVKTGAKPPVPVQEKKLGINSAIQATITPSSNSTQATNATNTTTPLSLKQNNNKGATVSSSSSSTQTTNVPSTPTTLCLKQNNNKESTVPSSASNPEHNSSEKKEIQSDTVTVQITKKDLSEYDLREISIEKASDFITNTINPEPLEKIVLVLTNRNVQAFNGISCTEYIIRDKRLMLPYIQKAKGNQYEVVIANRHDAIQARPHLKELWKMILECRTPDRGSFFVLIKKEEQKNQALVENRLSN